jgi:VWFA-related protein
VGRLSFFLILALAAVSVRAQTQPTFRTGANYVRVDLYASLDGRPVPDLKSQDVEILEDGVPQAIEAFEHVTIPGAGTQPRARVFVIFLDTFHTQIESSTNMRLPLIKFLDRVVGQDDMVAVVTPETPVKDLTFGRKATVISNIMQSDWAWSRGGRPARQDQKEELYLACYPQFANGGGPAAEMVARRREKLTLDTLDSLVTFLTEAREERKAILTISNGWMLFRANENLSAATKGGDQGLVDKLLRRPTKEKSEETGGSKEVNRVECEADRVALAGLDHTNRLRTMTEAANRGNVTFYSIAPRGITPAEPANSAEKPSTRGREASGLASREDSLRFIADNTDGIAVMNPNSVDTSIDRIVDDLSSYYLVGYQSSNTKLDGRFRTITARVKRDGVKVRARRGYRGLTADDVISSNTTAPGTGTGSATSGTSAGGFNPRAPFRIRTASWLHESSEGARRGAFWVIGELDYQTRRQLEWTAGAQAEVVVVGADGAEIVSRTVDLKTEDGPFSIQVPETGTLAPGDYAVRVRIRSQADAKLELSDTARVSLNEGSSLGEAVIWRRGPSTGPRYLRTADLRFTRNDRLRLELATSATTPAVARILDRKGSALSVPAQVSERQDESGAFRWIVIDALLSPFAPGDYSVEVSQGRDKRLTEFKIVP